MDKTARAGSVGVPRRLVPADLRSFIHPRTNCTELMTNCTPKILRIGLIALALAVFAPAVYAQGGMGGMGGGAPAPLSSEDVSDKEIQSAAKIIVAMQMQQQKMRKDMMKKYGNPQEMDSTQRRKARMEVMKKRQALMQKKTKEEDLSAQRLQRIMKSARQDSTLRNRMRTAVQEVRQDQMGGNGMQQGGPGQPGSQGQSGQGQSGGSQGQGSGGSR